MSGKSITLKPLLKWAGGKSRLLPAIVQRLPAVWNTYFEPFAGGAALLSYLYSRKKITASEVSDLNGELVNFYLVIRDQPEKFILTLSRLDCGNSRDDFYLCRKRFNEAMGNHDMRVDRAVLFMYLNRHSYNGLWRVNSHGEYNVPFGRYANVSYPGRESIMQFSGMLNSVIIRNADFRSAVSGAGRGDFVYFDPPYEPESRTASFTSYNRTGFSRSDQESLASLCRKLDRAGVQFMVSNSDTEAILELYAEFRQERVPVTRSINSVGEKRKGNHELIIINYEPEPGKLEG